MVYFGKYTKYICNIFSKTPFLYNSSPSRVLALENDLTPNVVSKIPNKINKQEINKLIQCYKNYDTSNLTSCLLPYKGHVNPTTSMS